jgi:hypothetical protein
VSNSSNYTKDVVVFFDGLYKNIVFTMNEDIESVKMEIKQKLENDLYVDRYSTFKESVALINQALTSFNINYQYTYNEFCSDFTNECLNYIEQNPTVDLTDPRQLMIHTLPMILSIVDKAKNKYGFRNDNSNSENTEQQVQEKTE